MNKKELTKEKERIQFSQERMNDRMWAGVKDVYNWLHEQEYGGGAEMADKFNEKIAVVRKKLDKGFESSKVVAWKVKYNWDEDIVEQRKRWYDFIFSKKK